MKKHDIYLSTDLIQLQCIILGWICFLIKRLKYLYQVVEHISSLKDWTVTF